MKRVVIVAVFVLSLSNVVGSEDIEYYQDIVILSPLGWTNKQRVTKGVLPFDITSVTKTRFDMKSKVIASSISGKATKCIKELGGGWLVEILSNTGDRILYTGLGTVFIKPDEIVSEGMKIGEVDIEGSTIIFMYMFIAESNYRRIKEMTDNRFLFIIPEKTPVHAVDSGIIKTYGYDMEQDGGFLEIITESHLFRYAHLKNFMYGREKVVEQGEEVAFSGWTGNIVEPSLSLKVIDIIKGQKTVMIFIVTK